MAIKLINENEKLVYEYEESKIFYRRITLAEAQNLEKRCVDRKNRRDNEKAVKLRLEHCVLGWEGVKGDDDNDLPFKKEYLEFLPGDIQLDLIKLTDSASGELNL